ncbi:MAG: hypothetical protein ACE5GA_11750, partial [Candidatus Zixiibacteriota bacterium]
MNDNALHERAKGAALSGARRFPLPPLALTTLGATAILILTYTGIKRNQSESFEILKSQGVTLLQTLVASADNAITANSYFWDSFVSRVAPVAQSGFTVAGAERVMERFPTNLEGITLTAAYTFDDRLTLLSSSLNPDADFQGQPREVFFEAASELLADSAQFQSLVFLPDSVSGSASAVFLQLDSTRTGGVCLLVDFPGLWEMESRIGIGRLIQRLGAARSVEYIFFQDPDGIVFSSRAIDSALAIGSDPFLSKAFDTDTISSRVYMFGESEALELVAPFSSTPYPDGLFRLGISLDTYNAGKTAFTQQMVLFGAILFLFEIMLPL